ncbi:MAG TPA: hypothetical protein VEQ85_07780 [Lacipirellulaceae bacterium]|nr:hypothetical protein [Lacipirellulaceae bacterium]
MFDKFAAFADEPDRLIAEVAQSLAATGDMHRLFELRLLQERRRLGLAIDRRTSIDDVDEPLRSQLEAAYLAACREVGELLLEAGRLREAWMYLRPAGDKLSLRRRLARVTADEARADELIQLALFEGVDPERGFAWLLARQGSCQGITALDALQDQLSLPELSACAAVLVRHLSHELQGNLRGHLSRLGRSAPPELSVGQLIERFPELQSGGDYHVDPSHLASAMRYARLITEPAVVSRARDMAAYGARLPAMFQYAGEPPFEDLYAAHHQLFQATLGVEAEAAVNYFAARATSTGTPPAAAEAVEAYLVVLARAGRWNDALAAYRELVPVEQKLSRFAPTLLELAQRSGAWELYGAICRERQDLLGYATGLIAQGAAREGHGVGP